MMEESGRGRGNLKKGSGDRSTTVLWYIGVHTCGMYNTTQTEASSCVFAQQRGACLFCVYGRKESTSTRLVLVNSPGLLLWNHLFRTFYLSPANRRSNWHHNHWLKYVAIRDFPKRRTPSSYLVNLLYQRYDMTRHLSEGVVASRQPTEVSLHQSIHMTHPPLL